MDRNEKKQLREHIGKHLDVSASRLTDGEAEFLADFVDTYDDKHRGRTESRESSYTGWSSDGKYTRTEQFTDTFMDEIGIRQDRSYHDDDGQTGQSSTVINDARGILNWFRDNG